jgi:hypothetical protein
MPSISYTLLLLLSSGKSENPIRPPLPPPPPRGNTARLLYSAEIFPWEKLQYPLNRRLNTNPLILSVLQNIGVWGSVVVKGLRY